MNVRHLPGAVVTPGQKRAGSPGHAQSARNAPRLARRGHGTGTIITTTLAHRGPGRSVLGLAQVALVSGAWRAAFPLAQVAEGSHLAQVAGDRVARAWGAAI
jgi:hypothetical protein